ncbi:MAG: sensor histidine kinase [Suipraeoptans sp.]
MKKFKEMSIKSQIRITIIAISVISTIILGMGSYFISKNTIEKNYRNDFKHSLNTSNEMINYQITEIVAGARDLLTDTELVNILQESEHSGQEFFTAIQGQSLEKAISNMIYKNDYIAYATIVDTNGTQYSFHKNIGVTGRYTSDNILEQGWISEADKAKGKEIFFTKNVLDDETSDVLFSMVKQLRDIKTDNVIGYLVVNIRNALLDNAYVMYGHNYGDNSFFVAKGDEEVGYFNGDDSKYSQIMKDFESTSNFGSKYVFTSAYNSLLNWEFVSVVSKNDLLGDSRIIGIQILLMLIILILIGILVSNMISGLIYHPLNQLSETIKEVGEGKRKITTQFDAGEVGVIGEQFKTMVNNNLELRENLLVAEVKEREAELLLIQSQINPHFLYNTLDSIYCMAIIEKQDNIARMTESLSKMFRLSLNNGNKLVQVKDEIAHISAYMNIQDCRFLGKYKLTIDIPYELRNIYMMKFVLQPFVENAMYHGLEPKMTNGNIRVRARVINDDLFFYIEDDGVGMENVNDAYKGYGVNNVSERIKLYYGDECGVSFESTRNIGTRVTVKIKKTLKEGDLIDE